MPAVEHLEHIESHFTASAAVRDIVIGMADGLTVPFALAAGLTGAVASTAIVVTAGFAEIAAGSIAMGLGGYLAERPIPSTTLPNASAKFGDGRTRGCGDRRSRQSLSRLRPV